MPTSRSLSRRRPSSAPILIGLALLTSILPACTGLEPAVVGAGATAAESGVSFFQKGKVTTFEPVTFEDAMAASRYAIELLQLRIVVDEADPDDRENFRHRFSLRDERGVSVVMIIDRRTPAVTRIRADVGTFGPTLLAGLLINKTIEELRRMAAYDHIPRPSPPPPPPTP